MTNAQLRAARDYLMKVATQYNESAKTRQGTPVWVLDMTCASIFLELSSAIHAAIEAGESHAKTGT